MSDLMPEAEQVRKDAIARGLRAVLDAVYSAEHFLGRVGNKEWTDEALPTLVEIFQKGVSEP